MRYPVCYQSNWLLLGTLWTEDDTYHLHSIVYLSVEANTTKNRNVNHLWAWLLPKWLFHLDFCSGLEYWLMPSLGQGRSLVWPGSHPLHLHSLCPSELSQSFCFLSSCIWIWCPETVYWALQGSNQSTKAKSICCEVSVRNNHHSLHQFPFPPLTLSVCTFSFEESNTRCKLLRFDLRWSDPWFSSTFDFISLYV